MDPVGHTVECEDCGEVFDEVQALEIAEGIWRCLDCDNLAADDEDYPEGGEGVTGEVDLTPIPMFEGPGWDAVRAAAKKDGAP